MFKNVTVTKEHFRRMMRFSPQAVYVATTDGVAGLRGVTVSSVCSISDSPPTVLICLMKARQENKLFSINRFFCLNLLEKNQTEIAEIFAGKREGSQKYRFDKVTWKSGVTQSPLISGAIFHMECEIVKEFDYNTHDLILSKVIHVQCNQKNYPLLTFNGSYNTVKSLF